MQRYGPSPTDVPFNGFTRRTSLRKEKGGGTKNKTKTTGARPIRASKQNEVDGTLLLRIQLGLKLINVECFTNSQVAFPSFIIYYFNCHIVRGRGTFTKMLFDGTVAVVEMLINTVM